MESDQENEFLPPEIEEAANKATFELLPSKSKRQYEFSYDRFLKWCDQKNVSGKEASEKVLLAYFEEMSKIWKSSTLWSNYSMLKSMMNINNHDISRYYKLVAFLKRKGEGYRPKKSKVLKREQIDKFLAEAPDEIYLTQKVAAIFGVFGACRREELCDLTLNNIEDSGTSLVVHIPDTKTNVQRIFVVSGALYMNYYKKYIALRPVDINHSRVFIKCIKNKCARTPVGINTFGKIPTKIAEFLNLPDSHLYTGHCFRRSSASLLADSGASLTTIKRHGGWKSSTVSEGYIEDSLQRKQNIADQILSKTSADIIALCPGYQHHTNQRPPRITEHPVDTVVGRHEPATLNCQADGEPKPTLAWFKDGVELRTAPQDSRSHRVLLPAGGLFFLRAAHGRKESDAGVYWCEASNALGKTRSRNATLTVAVLRDEFRSEPQGARVAAGEDIVLECQPPRGLPEPSVIWRKDGRPLTVEGRLRLVDGHNLAVRDARPTDGGRYQCVAKNAAGERESQVAVLKVYVKPFVIRAPEDTTALIDSTVELSCAVGGDPLPDVLWRRSAPGGTMPLGRVRVLEDRTLRLDRVTLLDQGRYTCDADNFAGAISASAVLTVHAPPSFISRPQAQTVEMGQEVSFRCNVKGNPKPFVFWSFEGDRALLYTGATLGNFEVFTTAEGHSTLVLKEAQVQNSGTVVICSAINAAGSASTRTRLTVTSKEDRPPPVIISGPVNQTLPINSVAYISCEANGNPAPVISWYKDGVPVSSSHRVNMTNPNHLEIYHLQKEDSGSYTCVASSRMGKATWVGYLLVENPKNPNINFFKAPELIMLPGPPSRPHALNQSEGSVTITWGQNNKIGSSSLLGYQIELFGREENVTPTWTVVGRRVSGPTFTQHLLSAGVPYTFLVRAENAHGIGPPSQLSEPIVVGPDSTQNWGNPEVTVLSEARANLVTSNNIVKLMEAIPLTSTSIKLVWVITDLTYIEGLYIYYLSFDTSKEIPNTYSMLTVLHTGGSSSFTVNNLGKWSNYEFFLVPFFKTVEGHPSNSKTIRTLEDVPAEPPSHMEALLLNSTAVFLKWKSPTGASLNGELQGYKVEIKTNGTDSNKIINVGKTPSLLLGNLSSGISYFVRVAALTRAGLGPYNPAATLRLEPASRTTDNNYQRPIGADMQSGDFITETWFMALLISMVSVMVLLFGAMFFVRRRQMLHKKSMTPSRSNGAVLTTPLDGKHEAPLWLDKDNLPEYSSTLPEYSKLNVQDYKRKGTTNGSIPQSNGLVYHGSVNLRSNPLHQNEFTRPDNLLYSSEKCYPINNRNYKDYSSMQVQDYASPNLGPDSNKMSQVADYAEVNANVCNNDGGSTSPAPYATTTLVAGAKRTMWNSFAASTDDECPYPSANGGYYNRKVYSDSYFSPVHTLRRGKKDNAPQQQPPDLVSPSGQPVYARVGPPGLSWRKGAPSLSSFTPHKQVYHGSTRSEPGNML